MSSKEIRDELAEDYKKMAELQENIANKECLLPENEKFKTQRGYSVIYGQKFKAIIEKLSPSEMKVMWCVKEQFDNHPATKEKKTEVLITANSIQSTLAEEGIPLNIDTVRKAIKTLVDHEFIKPLSDSIKQGKRSVYRLNPFVAGGQFAEPLGKLQNEWKVLFP